MHQIRAESWYEGATLDPLHTSTLVANKISIFVYIAFQLQACAVTLWLERAANNCLATAQKRTAVHWRPPVFPNSDNPVLACTGHVCSCGAECNLPDDSIMRMQRLHKPHVCELTHNLAMRHRAHCVLLAIAHGS